MRTFVEGFVAFVASMQYPGPERTYLPAQEPNPVSHVVKQIRSKPLPPAAGKFGELAADKTGGHRPSGCPSVDQFEARFLLANDPKHPPRAA